MTNYICIVESERFNVHQFVRDVLNDVVNPDFIIHSEDFINTTYQYFINKNKSYQLYANVIKDNINYIAAVNTYINKD